MGEGPAREQDATGPSSRLRLSWLRPPRSRTDLVERRELVERLSVTATPLVLLSTPAGWGKSTVLAQWSRRDPRPGAWLHLDRTHNDPVVFLSYLCAALAEVAEIDPGVAPLLDLPVPPLEERILPALMTAVAVADPFLLIFDDAQEMVERACWAVIEALLEESPEGGQIALGTRDDPPLPLARLRAAGALAEFRTQELAFTSEEAREMFAAAGCPIDGDILAAALSRTEGWAAGLYLTSLACPSTPLPLGEAMRGDRRDVAAYFAAEVLDRQPDDVQSFLLRTSILDGLDPAACRVITGRRDARDLLGRLARENLFVLPLDEHGEHYRYHRLFAEFLREELAQRKPEECSHAHTAAAAWYESAGDLDGAVRHRLAAGEVDAAALLVARSWPRLWAAGRRETVRRWLGLFTDGEILDRLPLTLTAGWVYSGLDDVELGRRWSRAACSARADDTPSPDGAASLRASQALLRATLAPDGVARMREDAQLAAQLESTPGSSWYADAMEVLGTARWLSGSARQSIRPLRIAAREGEAFNPSAELAALGTLALVHADLDEWDEAQRLADRAADRLARLGYGSSRRSLPLLLARARVGAHRKCDDVRDSVERAERVLERMVPHRWMGVMASVLLGEALIESGDVPAAAAWSCRATEALRHCPDAGIFGRRAERLRQALEAALHAEPLTPAERRVLELLPTHLTDELIARRLVVSTNTVKTHLRALYRKLEARSRAEAVERARRLGLLPPR